MNQWTKPDASACPVCRRENCDDPSHQRRIAADLPPPPLAFSPASEVMTHPAPVEIVEGVAQAGCITVMVSESGGGKTFVLLNLAAAVTSGVAWHKREVLHGSVAYLSFEGDALGLRLRAIRDHQGHRFEHLHILRAHDPLSPHLTHEGEQRSLGELTALAALQALTEHLAVNQRPPIRLLVVDTIRASLTGSEDNSEPVAAYLRVIRRLLVEVPNAAAILAHHAGWQDGDSQRKRERGSSAWRGNCDITVYLEGEATDPKTRSAHLTLKVLKIRDGEHLAPLALIRRQVDLNERTRRGQPVTSCLIESDHRTREDKETEAAALLDQAQLAGDLKVLRAIAEHPDQTTSQDRFRLITGIARKETISEALSRLVRKRWIQFPDKQRQPYTLTGAGQEALTAELRT